MLPGVKFKRSGQQNGFSGNPDSVTCVVGLPFAS